jgi:putative ABC transport system permease protein
MIWFKVTAARLRGLFAHQRKERELDDEVRFHLEMQAEDHRKAGMTPAEARNAALRGFGGIEPMKETYRESSTFAPLENAARDSRYALRTLGRSPGFTLTSVAVLALAIGAGTALFSVLNAVLLRPLPFPEPSQLVMLWTTTPGGGQEARSAYWTAEQWRIRSQSFSAMAVFDPGTANVTTAGVGEQISAAAVSVGFFPLLGVEPALGRVFSQDETSVRQRLVLISHRYWQARFAGSPTAIGADIDLDGVPARIIGVLPSSFRFPKLDADVWMPHTISSDWPSRQAARGAGPWFVLGRLRRGVTLEQSQAEMTAVARRLEEQMPAAQRDQGVHVSLLSRQLASPASRLALWMLTGAVLCVLLIAITNCAGLSLARSAWRGRELAIRAALGASRVRLAGQLLAESLVLSLASGLFGLALAAAAIRVIRAARPGDLARLDEAGLDARVLACTLGLSLLTGLLVGLAPSLWTGLRQGGRGIAGGVAAQSLRRALVVVEFGLAILLLAGAGLLVRSLRSVQNMDPGFQPERVLTAQLAIPAFTTLAQRRSFYDRAMEQVEALPGVESAGLIENLFLGSIAPQALTVERPSGTVSEAAPFRLDEISGGFFKALGAPLIRGRLFTAADGPGAPRVAIVNQAMVRRLWQGNDPIGRRFKQGAADSVQPWFTVVGVVGDMRRQGLEQEPIPQMFAPLAQDPPRLATLLVRSSGNDPLRLAAAVQAAVHRVDKQTPVYGVAALDSRLGDQLAERRYQTTLLIGFSLVALLMAAIGICGLIQYSVATRTHEIGIRLAVGAEAGDVFRMILGEGLKLSLTGLGLGLAGAFWLNRAFSGLLFGVTPNDPLTLAAVSLLLTAAAAAACFFPARRAMKIEPVVALRQD